MKTMRWIPALLVAAVACESAPVPDGPVARTGGALWFWEPIGRPVLAIELVGRGLNGTGLNGKALDGHFVVAVSLDGVVLPKGPPRHVKLARTAFEGLPGSRAVGAVFTGRLDDGEPLALRADSVR